MEIKSTQMARQVGSAASLLKALSHPNRLMIICRLADGEQNFADLKAFLNVRSAVVSQHLRILRKEGLIGCRRDGRTQWYFISADDTRQLVDLLHRMFCPEQAN